MYYILVSFFLCVFSCSREVRGADTNTGFFWHVTDIHVDQNYSRTGNPNNLCHNEKTLYPDNGLYGNFLCDSPEYLVNVTFQAMKKIKTNPDFIIWTGDNLPHTISFDPDWNVIYEALNNVTLSVTRNFPEVPVYPCIGNHDTFPPNMLLPNDSSNSIYKNILTKGGWSKFLNDEAASTFITGGYFSQVIKPGLRMISLNTILWYTPNKFTADMIDPANQFDWLESTLNKSSKSLEKVYIIGHVPPGFYNRVKYGEKSDPTYHPQHLDAYLKILKKYSKIILGQMFGHLHIDMFQLFLLESGNFVSSSLLASSVTPWHFISSDNISLPVNPSIRLMHYNRESGLLQDYNQFYLNLSKANSLNKSEESSNLYELLYTFTKSYNVQDVSTESLIEVYEKIKKNSTLFDIFFNFSTAGKDSVVCDSFCKVAQLCSISSTSINEYNSCMESKDRNGSDRMCHDIYALGEHNSNGYTFDSTVLISSFAVFLFYLSITLAVIVSGFVMVKLFKASQRCMKSHSKNYSKL